MWLAASQEINSISVKPCKVPRSRNAVTDIQVVARGEFKRDFKDGKGSFRGKGGFRDGDDFKGGKRGSKFGGGRGFKRGDTGDFKNKKRDFDDED